MYFNKTLQIDITNKCEYKKKVLQYKIINEILEPTIKYTQLTCII